MVPFRNKIAESKSYRLAVPEQIPSKPASTIYVPVPDTTILTKTSQSLSEKAKKAPPLDEGTGEPPKKKRKRRSN